jgi:hypothetical protein
MAKAISASLVEACESPRLFNFKLWPRQRELLETIDDGARRIHCWALGRRSGKSTLASIVALHDCLLRPELDEMVRKGEHRYAVAVATRTQQARLIVSAARSIVEQSPLLAGMLQSATEDELRFKNGTVLSAFPCSSRGGRGWPISTLILDELAHFVSDASEGFQTASRVWDSLAPATAQFADRGRIIASSTPYGSDGLFAELWSKCNTGELADGLAQQLATVDVNPTIPVEFLERERARDPESYKSEYQALFVGSGLAYLDPELIDDAVVDRPELPPSEVRSPIAGLDPAFSSDPFGLAILDRVPGDRRLRLALARSWLPQRSSSFEERREVEDQTLAQVIAELKRYRVHQVTTDQYVAPAVMDRLRRAGFAIEAVPMTATSKTQAFAELRAKLYSRELELYHNPDLIAELRRLRSRYTAGSSAVINPRVGGSHGDMAQALALAVFRAGQSAPAAGAAVRAPQGGWRSGGYVSVADQVRGGHGRYKYSDSPYG